MTPIKVNLQGVDAPGRRDTLPVGSYQADIYEVETWKARTGTPMLRVKFVCVHDGFEGKKVERSFALTENAMPFLKELLTHTGVWTAEELNDNAFTFDEDDLVDCSVGIVIEPHQFTGNRGDVVNTTQVAYIIPVEDATGPDAAVVKEPVPSNDRVEKLQTGPTDDDLEGLFPA